MKLEFLLCGSPNDAFYSQFAFFRMSLDALGNDYRDARVVCVLGAEEVQPTPEEWKPYLERIELIWARCEDYRQWDTYAQGDLRFDLIRSDADIACLCDADTVMVQPFSESFLREMLQSPAISALIAHHPLPIAEEPSRRRRTLQRLLWRLHNHVPRSRAYVGPLLRAYGGLESELMWAVLGQHFLGQSPDMSFTHTLPPTGASPRCPFYVNYGFLAGTPKLLRTLGTCLQDIQPELATILGKETGFYGQAAIALGVDRLGLPRRALPMRFNFPNDPQADIRYPEELESIILLHYLRTDAFDRHEIFASEDAFSRFMSQRLSGSNRVLQDHVRRVTAGRYPFER